MDLFWLLSECLVLGLIVFILRCGDLVLVICIMWRLVCLVVACDWCCLVLRCFVALFACLSGVVFCD